MAADRHDMDRRVDALVQPPAVDAAADALERVEPSVLDSVLGAELGGEAGSRRSAYVDVFHSATFCWCHCLMWTPTR